MWYSAGIFLQSVHNDCPTDDDGWELQVLLITASSEVEARIQAEKLGKEREHEYISATGDKVRWVFRQLESISEVLDEDLKPGTEVYSRFLRASEVRSLLTPFQDA